MLLGAFSTVLVGAVGIFLLFLLCKILKVSARILAKLLWNAVCGVVVLFIFNLLGGIFDLSIAITPLSAILAGVLGVPGLILLLLFQ